MSLRAEFEKSGAWLFRYRSFFPLVAVPALTGSFVYYHYVDGSHALTEIGQMIGFLVSLAGLGVRLLTIGYAPAGTSGRNTRSQVADKLNTTGMYSIVRHPLYLGNYLVMLGLLLGLHNWSAFLLATCFFCIFYERVMFAEEAFLRIHFGHSFDQWAARTPAFFPNLRSWKKPHMSFCWRTVLRREYTGIFLITTLFFLIDFIGDSFVERHLKLDWKWIFLFAIGLLTYLSLRMLKKHTTLLHVPGR